MRVGVFRKVKSVLSSPINCICVVFSTNKALQDQCLATLWTSANVIWREKEKWVYLSFKTIPQHPGQYFTHSNHSINTCWKETQIPNVCACSLRQFCHGVTLTISPYAQTSHSIQRDGIQEKGKSSDLQPPLVTWEVMPWHGMAAPSSDRAGFGSWICDCQLCGPGLWFLSFFLIGG